jgi:hypothetical protein
VIVTDTLAVTRYLRAALVAQLEGDDSSEPFLSRGKVRRNLALLRQIRRIANKFGKMDYIGLASPWLRDVQLFAGHLASVHVYERERTYLPIMVANAQLIFGWDEFSYTCGDILTDIDAGQALSSPHADLARPWILNLDFCANVDLTIAAQIARCVAERRRTGGESPGLLVVTFQCHGAQHHSDLLAEIAERLSEHGIACTSRKAVLYRGNYGEKMGHVSLVL